MTGESPSQRETSAVLCERVHAIEDAVVVPPDLLERVTAARRPTRARRWATAAVVTAAVLGVLVGVAGGIFGYRQATRPRPLASVDSVELAVYNAEAACQSLRIIECGLGVTSDPRQPTPQKLVARVWHGDVVTATCVVPDGARIADETGVTTSRWYRVTTRDGVTGYLPGIRVRNTVELPLCSP